MSGNEIIQEQPILNRIRNNAARIIAAAAVAGGIGVAAQHGFLDDRNEAPIIESAHSLELEKNPYYGKLAVDGVAFDMNGNIIRVDSLVANPLTGGTYKLSYIIKDNPAVDGDIKAYRNAGIGTGLLDNASLKSSGLIDRDGSMVATMVYGEKYGEKINPDNIFGNHPTAKGVETGLFWKIEGKNSDGSKIDGFIPAPLAVVDKPVIRVDITK